MDSSDDLALGEEQSVLEHDSEISMIEEPSQDNKNFGEETEEDEKLAEGEWKVEKIVDRRQRKRFEKLITEYKIRWEGFQEWDDTWEAEDSLNCRELLDEFNVKCQKKQHDVADSDVEVNAERSKSPVDGLYLVEKILDMRIKRGRGPNRREFLLQWKDYPGEDSWEERIDAPELLEQFLAERGATETVVTSSRKKTAARKSRRPRSVSLVESSTRAKRTSTRGASTVFNTEPVFQRPSRDEKEESPEQESRSDEEYEVAEVIGRRDRGVGKNRFVEYRIRWKGSYAPSWEPEEKLECPELIKDYENGVVNSTSRTNQLAVRRAKSAKMAADKPYPSTKQAATDSVVARRGSRRNRDGDAVSDQDQSLLLGEFVQNFEEKVLPTADRYPRRSQKTLAVNNDIPNGGGLSSLKKRRMARMTANGTHHPHVQKKSLTQKTSKLKTANIPKNFKKNFSKDLQVYLMRGSEILAVKSFKYNPKDIVEWKNLQYNDAEVPFEAEAVKVFGRALFTDFPDQVFFLVIQATAPHLYLGITEEFMRERYPKTYESLEPESLLQVGTELKDATVEQEKEEIEA